MSMAPESAVSPVSQAPPDRATATLEQLLQQVMAVIFGDRKLDLNEQRLLRGFMEEVAMRAQAGGGIGQGGTPSPDAAAPLPPSPQEMNQQTSPMYSTGDEPPPDDQGQ